MILKYDSKGIDKIKKKSKGEIFNKEPYEILRVLHIRLYFCDDIVTWLRIIFIESVSIYHPSNTKIF